MPRLLGKLPSYRKHKATGQAVVTLSGRDFYLGPYGTKASKDEYDRRVREWNAAGGIIDQDKRDEITLVELVVAFMRYAKGYYVDHDGRPTGELAGYQMVVKRLSKTYGRTLVGDFGPLKFKAFRQAMVDERVEGTPRLCRKSINQAMNRLRHIIKWGVENELVRASVHESLRCVAGLRYGKGGARETAPITPVADAFVDATIDHCSPQVAAMIQLQRLAGMRSGEVCSMRTADINTQGKVWTYSPARHKTQHRGHARMIYLGPRAQAVLRPWLRADLDGLLFQPAEAEAWRQEQRGSKRTTPRSCGNRPGTNRKAKPKRKPGTGFTPAAYGKSITNAIERCNRQRKEQGQAEIPHWHPHQLRHNAATWLRKEFGLDVARVVLGHRSAAVTEIYAELDQAKAAEVMGKVG